LPCGKVRIVKAEQQKRESDALHSDLPKPRGRPTLNPMRALPIMMLAVLCAACGADNPRANAAVAAAAAPPADLPGSWAVSAFRAGSDIAYVSYDMRATADTSGWTVTFPGREPMAVRVLSASPDSIDVVLGPYPSAVRQGVMVTAHTVGRVVGDRIEGRFAARYASGGPDAEVTGQFEGRRRAGGGEH
jgi:hypothetical protein